MSKRWIYRVCAVEDHRTWTLTISSIDGRKRIINSQKANFLAVELINILEIKNLGIDLVNEKIYQLIDDINKAEYYYN